MAVGFHREKYENVKISSGQQPVIGRYVAAPIIVSIVAIATPFYEIFRCTSLTKSLKRQNNLDIDRRGNIVHGSESKVPFAYFRSIAMHADRSLKSIA